MGTARWKGDAGNRGRPVRSEVAEVDPFRKAILYLTFLGITDSFFEGRGLAKHTYCISRQRCSFARLTLHQRETGAGTFTATLQRITKSVVTSDAGLLAYRELDDALGLTTVACEMLADGRTGRNGRHALGGLFRQSVFGRLAGYEDVNDAKRLRHDPAMRWIVGGKATLGCAASPSQMGRFETRWLAPEKNLSALADLSGQWIDSVLITPSAERYLARHVMEPVSNFTGLDSKAGLGRVDGYRKI